MKYSCEATEKLRSGKAVINAMVRFANPSIAVIMCKAGVDCIQIDNEHYPFTDEQITNIARAVKGCGVKCNIRLGQKDTGTIYRVLDMGVDGVLFPNVETAEEAAHLVASAKYPPVGKRGCCPITRGADYGIDLDVQEYYKKINDCISVEIMLESKKGLENLDEILKVKGLDGFSIGPSDMSGSYGRPGRASDPDIKADIDAAFKKILGAGYPASCLAYTIDAARKGLTEGKKKLGIRSDLQMLTKEYSDHVNGARARMAAFGYKDTGKSVKQKLRDREPVIAPFVRIAEPGIGEIAAMTGADFIMIDDEHYPFSDRELIDMIRAIHCRGVKVVVRPHDKSKAAIGRIMDMGADGIVAPQVRDAEEAKAIIDAVKYSPIGSRGLCPITAGANYGFGHNAKEYAEKANRESIVGLMVETKSAVDDLDNILKLKDQIDFMTMGPSDLSASYGMPGEYDNPLMVQVRKEITDKVVAAGVSFMGGCYNDDDVTECLETGKNALNIGSDVQYLIWGFTRDVKATRELIAEFEGR